MSVFRTQSFSSKNKRVVFLLPGWHIKAWMFWAFAKTLELNGFHCILYEYDSAVLSPNTKKTVDCLTLVRDDILLKIKNLKKSGYSDFAIFGTSLGSIIALMVANKSTAINRVVLNLVGSDIAETVWSWDKKIPYFKKALLEQDYTLNKLQIAWEQISPINNIDNLKSKKLLIYLAKNDEIIPIDLGLKLVKALQDKKYTYQLIINHGLKHFFAGTYNLVKARDYLTFLKS